MELVDLGFFELLGELPGIGGHGVEETALALGEEDVEGEGGLAGAGESGNDDELVAGDVERDVFEVVVAGASQGDGGWWMGDGGWRRGRFLRWAGTGSPSY